MARKTAVVELRRRGEVSLAHHARRHSAHTRPAVVIRLRLLTQLDEIVDAQDGDSRFGCKLEALDFRHRWLEDASSTVVAYFAFVEIEAVPVEEKHASPVIS